MAPPLPHAQVGSGKVTDSQVAFMVECYLRDSHFGRSLQEFRLEAARLLHPLRFVPKGARSLSAVLNDYVALKEEQIYADAEKARVEELFHGLQEILSVYFSGVTKNAVPPGGIREEALSVPPSASTVGTQQPHIQEVPCEVEAAVLPGKVPEFVTNQHAKEKLSSHKRKGQGKGSCEPLQYEDSCVDLIKKPRRFSNVKQSFSDPFSVGNSMSDPNVYTTGTDCLVASNTVQPATPPMTTLSCKSQQQQALPCSAMPESPQSSPSSETAQDLVSPKQTSYAPTPLPSANGDAVAQHRQSPQTPPPSTKSSLSTNSTSDSAQTEEILNVTTASGKPGNVQQRRKALATHLPSATSHYALRAHKKPSEASSVPVYDAQSNCVLKLSRKRAINSKCRLLDFSAAAENGGSQVNTSLKQSNKASSISASAPVNQSSPDLDSQQITESSAASYCERVPDLTSSSETLPPQEFEASEFCLPCDTFSFDDLFSLDLDTSLISELEDLSALNGCEADPSSCLGSSEAAALPFLSEPSSGVLTEIDNLIHPDEAVAFTARSSCLGASFKHRKPAIMVVGTDNLMDDKENMHTLVVSH